jgi:phosphatidylserine/phosphatidylglycerophosphate/cardiolipin synthase-like enzyme
MSTLEDLEKMYFETGPDGGPVYRDNSMVRFIRDGEDYFKSVNREIGKTSGEGDVVYLLGWRFDADMSLAVRPGPLPSGQSIGELLATKAAAGVDVRVILNGNLKVFQFLDGVSPFSDNLDACEKLRDLIVSGQADPPLTGRVLFDWSGATTGSHHMKAAIVSSGDGVVAFISGMDVWRNRWDDPAHNKGEWPNHTRWGWHDAAIEVRGPATEGVWNIFKMRWMEASTLPPYTYQRVPAIGPAPPPGVNVKPFNPLPLVPPPPDAPRITPLGPSGLSVQVMQSRFHSKYPRFILPDRPWDGSPAGGIRQVYATLVKAINNAVDYVYVEDQFIADSVNVSGGYSFSLQPVFRAAITRGVKVVFVGSSKSDPDDLGGPSRKNLWPTTYVVLMYDPPSPAPRPPPGTSNNVVVWRVNDATVHAKLMIIDDKFVSLGSANIQSRSMYGVDSEIQIGVVDVGTQIQNFRMELWAEHLRIGSPPWPDAVEIALRDVKAAAKIWRPEWFPPPVPGLWRDTKETKPPGNPPGFAPIETGVSVVGPVYVL